MNADSQTPVGVKIIAILYFTVSAMLLAWASILVRSEPAYAGTHLLIFGTFAGMVFYVGWGLLNMKKWAIGPAQFFNALLAFAAATNVMSPEVDQVWLITGGLSFVSGIAAFLYTVKNYKGWSLIDSPATIPIVILYWSVQSALLARGLTLSWAKFQPELKLATLTFSASFALGIGWLILTKGKPWHLGVLISVVSLFSFACMMLTILQGSE